MSKVFALTFLLTLLLGAIPPAMPTAAGDTQPCGERYWHSGVQMEVQECSLWSGSVPVVAGVQGAGMENIVGELVNAEGNWFTCQLQGAFYQLAGTDYVNNWWAATMADNGQWGFVNQTYFAGGDNNEPDANLAPCSSAPTEPDPTQPPPTEEPIDYEWSDCLWGGAPDDYIVATFASSDGNTYTLNCQNVRHIHAGHGFNEWTIPCIDRVLSFFDKKEPSETDPRNDLFRYRHNLIDIAPGNWIYAYVVTDRANLRVVTAYVELKTIEYLIPYEGDPWAACVPTSTAPTA